MCLQIFKFLNKGAAHVKANWGNMHNWARKNLFSYKKLGPNLTGGPYLRNWDISHLWQWVSHLFFCSLILAALGRNKWSAEIIITVTFNWWYSEYKDLSANKWFWGNFGGLSSILSSIVTSHSTLSKPSSEPARSLPPSPCWRKRSPGNIGLNTITCKHLKGHLGPRAPVT